MAHSFTSLHLHMIFSTKNRDPILTPGIRPRLFKYMGGIIRGLKGTSLLINGVDDHVHLLTTIAYAPAGAKMKLNPSDPWLRHGLYSLGPGRGKNTRVPLLSMPGRISYAPGASGELTALSIIFLCLPDCREPPTGTGQAPLW